ncbi:DNA polymerase IV [Pseudomonas putida]|uniref:DNA polymerase IV n=1 Tax=Pseudomonas putida TaxID=303 RepID=UPI0018E6746F|nr:DNA polymerase IV [Pseudomonas putida]MBI6925431.1 DNA polymerase IV [Pseudomonas putida]
MSENKFIHIDMDSFFVSVELLSAPHLHSKPVAVGGAAAERGVISTANYIAREYGVKSGMATAAAYRLCPGLVLLPCRFDAYEAVTRQMDVVFRRYTDRVDFLSLDEATLDVTGQLHCKGSATLMADEIRSAIKRELSLTASAGVAPLKYLAKIASEVNKPNGLYVISPSEVKGFLDELDLRKIPGVGPKTYAVLEHLGCRLCKDLTEEKIPALVRHLGVHGFYVWERCQGIEVSGEKLSNIRSHGVERTLPFDCFEYEACIEELNSLFLGLENKISPLINANNFVIKNLVKLKFSDFTVSSSEAPASSLCKDTVESLCRALWNSRRQARAVRLIGLSVKIKTKPTDDVQLELPL